MSDAQSKAIIKNARAMRREPTDAERRLWAALRGNQLNKFKFRRQHPIGNCIADFACISRRLIIEADGGQHADNSKDEQRTKELERLGWTVIRFWNPDILKNTEGVLETILQALNEPTNVENEKPFSPFLGGEGLG